MLFSSGLSIKGLRYPAGRQQPNSVLKVSSDGGSLVAAHPDSQLPEGVEGEWLRHNGKIWAPIKPIVEVWKNTTRNPDFTNTFDGISEGGHWECKGVSYIDTKDRIRICFADKKKTVHDPKSWSFWSRELDMEGKFLDTRLGEGYSIGNNYCINLGSVEFKSSTHVYLTVTIQPSRISVQWYGTFDSEHSKKKCDGLLLLTPSEKTVIDRLEISGSSREAYHSYTMIRFDSEI